MLKKRIIRILLIPAVLLLIPLIAMQFSEELKWNIFDFIVAGILLISAFFLMDLAWRKIRDIRYRLAILFTILIFLLLVWAELAVGIL